LILSGRGGIYPLAGDALKWNLGAILERREKIEFPPADADALFAMNAKVACCAVIFQEYDYVAKVGMCAQCASTIWIEIGAVDK
jgi:hypothetical protein